MNKLLGHFSNICSQALFALLAALFVSGCSSSWLVPRINEHFPPNQDGLANIILNYGTVYSPEQLNQDIEPFLGNQVTHETASIVAEALTQRYRADGFVLSSVTVPEGWNYGDGIILLEATERSLSSIEFWGAEHDYPELAKAIKTKVLSSEPYNQNDLEEALLYSRNVFGVTAKHAFKPPSQDGALPHLSVFLQPPTRSVKTNKGTNESEIVTNHLTAELYMDNRGSDEYGNYNASLSLAEKNHLGRNETANVSFFLTEKLTTVLGGRISYQEPINLQGTYFGFDFSHNRSEAGGSLKSAEIKGGSTSANFTLGQPLTNTLHDSFTLFSRLSYRNFEAQISGQTTSEDRLRSVSLGSNFSHKNDDENFIGWGTLSLTKGLNILNSTKFGSSKHTRANGEPSFLKATASLNGLYKVTPKWEVSGGFNGQYSFDKLLSGEEFKFGGGTYGRGYDSSEISGQHGFAIRIEPGYLLHQRGSSANRPDIGMWDQLSDFQNLIDSAKAYAFYDFGAVYGSGPTGSSLPETAASTGLGLKWKIADRLEGSFEFAKPLTRPVSSQDNSKAARFFFGLSLQLGSW